MKRLIPFLALLFALPALAADRITAVLTVTNAPTTNGQTLVVNGDTRTFTNAFSATTILTNGSAGLTGAVATNVYRHVTTNGFSGPLLITQTATNQLTFLGQVGQAMSVAANGGWASVAYTTQTVTQLRDVRVPMTGESATNATNIASMVVAGINTFAVTPFSMGTTAMTHFATLTTAQTLSNKVLLSGGSSNQLATNLWVSGGAITNAGTNHFSGSNILADAVVTNYFRVTSNAGINNLTMTNGVNRGTGFVSYSNLSSQVLIGEGAYAGTNIGAIAIGGSAVSTNSSSVGIGYGVGAHGVNAIAIGGTSLSYGNRSVGIGYASVASNLNSIAMGYLAISSAGNAFALGSQAVAEHTNSFAIGVGVTTTDTNQIAIGAASYIASFHGNAGVSNNLVVGRSSRTNLATGLVGGITLANGTSASADPTNGFHMNAASGEWIYRSALASEGAGQNNRVHNRGAEVVGSGTDYTLTASTALVDFGGTDPDINTLPSAGTYLITSIVTVTAGGTANDSYVFKLYNATAAADITSSSQSVTDAPASQKFQVIIQSIATVAGAHRIQLYGHNGTAARGTVNSTETKLVYVRLF